MMLMLLAPQLSSIRKHKKVTEGKTFGPVLGSQ